MLKLTLHRFSLLWPAKARLAARRAHHLLNVVVHTSKRPDTVNHCCNGSRR
uniref:Uncharacterized protein n=1 Tax=Arundo donax TaxID=35708 RepID=A0A0A8XVR8_ARUDO